MRNRLIKKSFNLEDAKVDFENARDRIILATDEYVRCFLRLKHRREPSQEEVYNYMMERKLCTWT
jgi:hypothetical protein